MTQSTEQMIEQQDQRPVAYDQLIKPDRVHRALYTDETIFREEMRKVFGQTWVYLAHESQLPESNSFLTLNVGLRPMIITRDRQGEIHALFNRCAHRAVTVCREESGKAKSFQCPYHGWTFKNTGDLVGTPWAGGYAPTFDKSEFGLGGFPRVESYRGFIFGTLNLDHPPLVEHLGPATKWLDYWIDRSPTGEVQVRKSVKRMVYRGNWKLAFDNGGDGYHPSFSHRSLLETASRLGDSKDMSYFGEAPDEGPMTMTVLGNGHSVLDQRPSYNGAGSIWANQRPQPGREKFEEHIRATYPEDADRLLDLACGSQINLSIFPNLLILGNQIQVVEPLSVGKTQLNWHSTSIGGVPDEVNTVRMRTQEDFPSFGEPDDQANFEEAQRGLEIPECEWLLINRGYDVENWQTPMEDGSIQSRVTDEIPVRKYYEAWQRVMNEETK